MDFTSGPSFWLILLTVGVIALGLAIAYGTMQSRKRTIGERLATEAGTRREYNKEDRGAG